MIFTLAIFLIYFEAVYEGLKTRGKHIASEFVELTYLIIITASVLMWASGIRFIFASDHLLWKTFAGYLLLRFAIFDTIWNISAGQKWNYIGNTKLYDKFLAKTGSWGWFVKIVSLIVGLTFLIK
jgi:hypothetical protein